MATKFSTESIYKPAPKWWRKLERALLIVLIPSAVMMLQSWGFKDELHATRLMLTINVGLVAIVKAIGMFMSNGEEYVKVETEKEV